jgi:FG-GAP repeat
MGVQVGRWRAMRVAVAVATPIVVAGVVAGTAPASSAASASPGYARVPAAPASGLAAASASLRAAIRRWLGYSQQSELAASDAASPDEFGWSVALSAPGGAALIGAPGHNSSDGAAYAFAPGLGT